MALPFLRILHLEDSAADAELIQATFESEGLDCNIVRTKTRSEFENAVVNQDFDVILSDYAVPQYDGFSALEFSRTRAPGTPFILVSGTLGEELAVESLKSGATDYILKQRLHRLVPAVKRAVREACERAELKHAEDELRTTHAKLCQLLEHSPAVIYALKLAGERIIPYLTSENVTGLLGSTVAETLAPDWWPNQVHPDDRERASASVKATLAYGVSRCEYRLAVKTGGYRWVEDNRRLVRDAAGQPKEIVGVWTDITERKELEQEVAVREHRLKAFFSGATAGLALFDRGLRYVQINDTLARMNGVPAREHLGRTPMEVLPKLGPLVQPVLEKVLASAEPALNVEIAGETPLQPGRIRHWVVSHFPITGANGCVDGVGSIVVEVTDRKRAEDALRDSELKFRQLAEHIQEVFWIAAHDNSRVVYVSPAFEKVWGRPAVDLYQSCDHWLASILPEDRRHVTEAFDKLRNGAGEIRVEYRISRPDGSVRWISDHAFPVFNSSGQLYRLAGIAADITERKLIDDQLRQSQKMEAIGQLAGGIAHDFNNILGCIVGYSELAMLESTNAQAVAENINEVLKASQRAKELVLQILTFSRKQEQERKPLRIQTVVKEALKLLRASLPATIEIHSEIGQDVPPILGDATQIHQIVMNLATNAAHAIGGRSGRLGVALRTTEADAHPHPDLTRGRYVIINVSDTGCGMDSATLQRIFEPFFTTKPPGEGTGLGLAVVHGIVKSHGGAIAVESHPGQGTTFHMYFPCHVAATVDSGGANAQAPRGVGQRILFIDDELPLAFLGRKLLERAGYRVTVKTDAVEALAEFRHQPHAYDLVMTDHTMPKITGDDLAVEILRIRPELPVIVTTGFAGAISAEKAQVLGVRELLAKPFTLQSLAEAADRAFRGTGVPSSTE